MKILFIIPAIKGSTRVKRKNTRCINKKGDTLLSRTLSFYNLVQNPLRSKGHQVLAVLTTDEPNILQDPTSIQLLYPNLVIRSRPEVFCTTLSDEKDFVDDIFNTYDYLKTYDIVVILYPTCPFRSIYTVLTMINEIESNKLFGSTRTVIQHPSVHPDKNFWRTIYKDGLNIEPWSQWSQINSISGTILKPSSSIQSFYPVLKSVPVCYIFNIKQYKDQNITYPFPVSPFVVSEEEGFDINTEFDMKVLKLLEREIKAVDPRKE